MNTKKKILFLVTQSEFGGAQRFIYTLVSRQFTPRTTPLDAGAKERCKGVLGAAEIVVGAGPEGDDKNGLLRALEEEGIKTEHLKNLRRSINPFFDFLGFLEIRKLIKKQNPDILFLCSTKAGFLGSLAAAFLTSNIQHPTVIYRIGGWTFNDPWPKWKKFLYLWLEKKTAKFKDFIVNNAESDKQQAIKLGIKPKKEIVTIYNGINIESLDFLPKNEARKILNLKSKIQDPESKLIGTIANNYPAKGLKYLAAAKKNLQNTEIVVLSGMSDASKYLNAFDIFVLPSVKEGFPWVVLEAMSAEIPVIATKVGAIPEIIKNGENGILIEAGNSRAITDAIKELSNNKNLSEKLAKNGRKTVIEKFTLDKMVEEYEKLLNL